MSNIKELAEQVIIQREIVPGMPMEGQYPVTVSEVADELFEFIIELDNTCARGVADSLYDLLFDYINGCDDA